MNENDSPNGDGSEDQNEELSDATAEGIYELCKALADLLRSQKVADAAAGWLNSQARQGEQKRNPTPYYVGLFFGLLVFVGIAVLAWHKVLDSQATVVLIGALIAAWWGGQKPKQ